MHREERKVILMDEKVLKIIGMFQEGKDKHEVSKMLGYKDYKGMQVYMKRHGYLWNDEVMNYQNMYKDQGEQEKSNETKNVRAITSRKAASIIAMLAKEMDTRTIAKKLNFESHKEMAEYMRSKGYSWNQEKRNYEYSGYNEEERIEEEKEYSNNNRDSVNSSVNLVESNYMELLEYLNENRERLNEMLIEDNSHNKTMPRYVVTGLSITKSVHMVSGLDQIIRDFSQEKNISQKEMFQIAMIEFFKKYGYKREIEALIAV